MTAAAAFDAVATEYDAARRRLVPCFDGLYGTVLDLIAEWGPPAERVFSTSAPAPGCSRRWSGPRILRSGGEHERPGRNRGRRRPDGTRPLCAARRAARLAARGRLRRRGLRVQGVAVRGLFRDQAGLAAGVLREQPSAGGWLLVRGGPRECRERLQHDAERRGRHAARGHGDRVDLDLRIAPSRLEKLDLFPLRGSISRKRRIMTWLRSSMMLACAGRAACCDLQRLFKARLPSATIAVTERAIAWPV